MSPDDEIGVCIFDGNPIVARVSQSPNTSALATTPNEELLLFARLVREILSTIRPAPAPPALLVGAANNSVSKARPTLMVFNGRVVIILPRKVPVATVIVLDH